MIYDLRQIDAESLAATKKAWDTALKKHSNELIPGEFRRILTWVESLPADGDVYAYGVFDGAQKVALAVAEVYYKKTGRKWLKMLNLNLSPALDVSLQGDGFDPSSGKVFFSAIIGTMNLTRVHSATTVKLYARSSSMLAFFKGIVGAFAPSESGKVYDFTIEGRWLVITTK